MPAVVNDISEDPILESDRDRSDHEPIPARTEEPDPGPSLGEVLRTARVARGLSPHQAAGQLRLLPRWIEAFEANQFDALGPPVYARGYLRKYAALLELPPDEILARYDQVVGTPAPQPLALIKSTGSEPVVTSRAPNIIGGIALVSVAAVLIIGITQTDSPAPPATAVQAQAVAGELNPSVETSAPRTEPVIVATTTETSPELAPAGTTVTEATGPQLSTTETIPASNALLVADPAEPAAATTLVSSASMPPSASESDTDDSAAVAAGAAADEPEQPLARVAVPMTQNGRNLKIKLSYKGTSWTTVYAADGTRLLYELSRRGRARTVSSTAPLTVVFGAIDAVEMRVNDQTIPIPRQPGKDSIKFVLDVEGSPGSVRSADVGG